MEDEVSGSYRSPLGELHIVTKGHLLRSITFMGPPERPAPAGRIDDTVPGLYSGLDAYFKGEPTEFSDIELDLSGMGGFDRCILLTLRRVKFGELTSYGELAYASGHPGAARAVGGAVHRNPFLIVVPCHRVVSRRRGGYGLGGFGAGIELKRGLLDLEGSLDRIS